jgi:hypothetical protein
LSFVADESGFSEIAELRSGAFDQDEADVQSGVNLGLSTLSLDITALNSQAATHVLMDTDAVIGDFEEVQLIGLSDTQDAARIIDYDTDTISLELYAPGAGIGSFSLQEIAPEMMDDVDGGLWAALTDGQPTYTDGADTTLTLADDAEEALLLTG